MRIQTIGLHNFYTAALKTSRCQAQKKSFLGQKDPNEKFSYDVFQRRGNMDCKNNITVNSMLKIKDAGIEKASLLIDDSDLYERVMLLMAPNENNQVVLPYETDIGNREIKQDEIILPRPLTSSEINALLSDSSGINLIKNFSLTLEEFLNLSDTGLNPELALKMTHLRHLFPQYYRLISANSDDDNKAGFDGRLQPDEAAAILLYSKTRLSDDALQVFIDLKDTTDLSDREVMYYVNKPAARARLLELTTLNDDGVISLLGEDDKEVILPRALSCEEAIPVLKVPNEKIKYYLQFLDCGIEISTALKIIRTKARMQKYSELMIPDEKGRLILKNKDGKKISLPRPLSLQEAQIVIGEKQNFTPEIIRDQLLEFDEIKSRRLTRYLRMREE